MKLTKEFVFYDFIYMRARVDRANLVKTKAEEYFFFLWIWGKGSEGNFWSNSNVLYFGRALGYTGVHIFRTQ